MLEGAWHDAVAGLCEAKVVQGRHGMARIPCSTTLQHAIPLVKYACIFEPLASSLWLTAVLAWRPGEF